MKNFEPMTYKDFVRRLKGHEHAPRVLERCDAKEVVKHVHGLIKHLTRGAQAFGHRFGVTVVVRGRHRHDAWDLREEVDVFEGRDAAIRESASAFGGVVTVDEEVLIERAGGHARKRRRTE